MKYPVKMWAFVESRLSDGHIFYVEVHECRNDALDAARAFFGMSRERAEQLVLHLAEYGEVRLNDSLLSVVETV